MFEAQVEEEKPIISYNFCDSLLRMFDEERELPFELMFNWSRSSLKSIPKPQVPDKVAFPFAYLSKLNELKEYLSPQKPEINDTFIGTVEELNGDLGFDGRRSGEVILNLLVGTEIIKTKLNLNADQYHDAIRAHERGPAYVRVRGKLHIHARLGRLDEIIEFRMEN